MKLIGYFLFELLSCLTRLMEDGIAVMKNDVKFFVIYPYLIEDRWHILLYTIS